VKIEEIMFILEKGIYLELIELRRVNEKLK